MTTPTLVRSLTKCQPKYCDECGDRLVHLTTKQQGESTNIFAQHICDHYDNSFMFMDIDGSCMKRDLRLFRLIEHKTRDTYPYDSQKIMLPILARGISHLVEEGLLHPQSGAYVAWCDKDFQKASISRVSTHVDPLGVYTFGPQPVQPWHTPKQHLTNSQVRRFFSGKEL